MKKLLIAAVAVSLAGAARAEEAAPRKWKDAAQLGLINATGNTTNTTYNVGNLFTYTDGYAAELAAEALGARASGVTTAEQYAASEKVAKGVGGANYVFEKIGWSKNRFAGVRSRWEGSLGYGRQLIKTDADKLDAEVGAGYVNEYRTTGYTNKFASGRAYAKYVRSLSASASFSQDLEYLYDFSDSSDYRLAAETGLVASVSTRVSLKLGFKFKHVNAPPPGFKKDDTLTSAALVFNF